MNPQKKRKSLWFVYLLATVLMIIRVDFWWWGEEMPLTFFGWFSIPMIYQFGVWLAGFMLVLYVAKYIWIE